jgi:hypothetical protein
LLSHGLMQITPPTYACAATLVGRRLCAIASRRLLRENARQLQVTT